MKRQGEAKAPVAAPLRVLLVDDSPVFLASASAWLEQQPDLLLVGTACSGGEALAVAGSLEPDLVLMDAAMPGMSGFEATRLLTRRARAPRVIIMTLSDSDVARCAARDAGADGFLHKPQLVEKLPALVAEVFGRTRLAGEGYRKAP